MVIDLVTIISTKMSETFVREFDEEVISVESSELANVKLSQIKQNQLIEISDLADNGVYYQKFEGQFGWSENQFCAFVGQDWYRKYWDLPLGLPFHMDLMRRLIEFKASTDKNIIDVDFKDDGDWCHLNYTILIPNTCMTMLEAYNYANEIIVWVEEIVQEAQENASVLLNTIVERYNEVSLVKLPDLIQRVKSVRDIDEKGKLLEELVARFFAEIPGFEIIERKRTKTEEIDIVIVNKSKGNIWEGESAIILVECKNWKKPAGKNEYVAFKEKLENRRGRAKLGFFISAKGFARTFGEEDLRNSKADLLIVPIDLRKLLEIIESKADYAKELEILYVSATTK